MIASNLSTNPSITRTSVFRPRLLQWWLTLIFWFANCYGIGLLFDTLSWNLSYDILFPRNDGTWKAYQIAFVTGPILAASLTISSYPLLNLTQLWQLGFLGVVLSWSICLAWSAISILFPGTFLEIPSQTLASPRRYVLLTSFRDSILPSLTFTVVIMLFYIFKTRYRFFQQQAEIAP
jgi:hypothetical protein